MNTISQTTFPSAFSGVEMFEFQNKIHWSFIPKDPTNNIPEFV